MRRRNCVICSKCCDKPKEIYCSLTCALGSRVQRVESGCLEWQGSLVYGYGQLKFNGRSYRAHRLAYELHHGADPGSLQVCHRCDNRKCVNPDHLFLGTHQDNMDDMVAKGRQQKGERAPTAKLNADAVAEIRSKKGRGSGVALAEKYGVTTAAISAVRKRKNWGHV